MSPRVTRSLHVAGWVVVGGGTVGLATQLIGTPNRPVAVVQSLTPWATPVLLVAVLVAARAHRDRLGFAAAAVTVLYLSMLTPLVFPDSGPAAGDAAIPFTVMSVNVLYSNDRIDDVAEIVLEADPDVVALSEVTPPIAEAFRTGDLAIRYPHRIERPASKAGGLVLWSKFELAEVPVEGFRRAIDVTVDLPGGVVRVVAVHPPPPVFDLPVWQRELAALPDLAGRTDAPLVMIGDLNASWFHPPFREALSDAALRDALTSVGRGLAMTWPTDELAPPFVTLDHVLVSDEIASIDGRTAAVPGSDHRAVVATLAFADS